jgi:response regulator of citrate/malate metabolism
VRDICAALADEFDYDLYSTSYIENIVNIVKKFQPNGIVIDLGLFEDEGIELHELLLGAEPPLNVLFLEGEDDELAQAAQTLAESIGFSVIGKLQMPISVNRLEHVLQHMA